MQPCVLEFPSLLQYNLLALTSTFYYRLITYTAEERIEEPIRADRHRHHCTHSHNHQNHRRLAAFDFQSVKHD